MINPLFKILRKRLLDQVSDLKEVRWYTGQGDSDRGRILASPSAYIQFGQITDLFDTTLGVQQGTCPFEVVVFSDSLAGDDAEKRQAHFSLCTQVFQALQGWSARASYIPGNEGLAGTANDVEVCGTIGRTSFAHRDQTSALERTAQGFDCQLFDFEAFRQYIEAPVNNYDITSLKG